MATRVAVVDIERIRSESNMIDVKIKALDSTDEGMAECAPLGGVSAK